MKKSILASAILAALSGSAMAEQTPDAEVYVGASRIIWDDDRNLDDASALELGLEVPVSEAFSVELWGNDYGTDNNSNEDLDGNRYSLGGLYHFNNDTFRPFVTLGGSHQEMDYDNGTEDKDSLIYAGVGAKNYFENNIIVRGDLIAMNSLDHEVTDFAARIALGYAFGDTPASAKANAEADAAAKQAQMEADKARAAADDAKAKADAKAAAEKAKADAAKKAMMDEKARAAAAAAAAANADADKDGVADSLDKCPETNSAYKVDANGCPVKLNETVSIKMNVQFETNSTQVTPSSEAEIAALAKFLKQFEGTNVTVEGHTDDRGRAAYNKSLSQKRADAVKAKLTKEYGVDGARISAKGLGEEQPIASNATAEGRATNRRVVAVVEAQQEKLQTK